MRHFTYWARGLRALGLLSAGTALLLLPPAAQAAESGQNSAQTAGGGAVAAVKELDGQGLEPLAVSWWRWLMSAPDNQDLLADSSGDLCGLGQSGPVWYLTGSYENDKVVRHCTIPQGKYVFVPMADIMLWDSAEGQDCSLLQEDAKTAMDTARNVYLELDGARLDNPGAYRAAMRQCFTVPGESDIYASDGYWAVLKPPAKGSHILRFGNIMGDGGETTEDSAQNIEYRITVE